MGMLRRMGTRAPPSTTASELDFVRAFKEIGVQTDKNGFITEEGLVAFYRDFGNLGEDLEASGVASLSSFLGLKLSAVGQIDASVAEQLETLLTEEHPRLDRVEKALLFFLRFASDVHLDCFEESIGDWVAPAEEDRHNGLLRTCIMGPGWVSRVVETMQQWLADGDRGVIPSFREAATTALGERCSAPRENLPSYIRGHASSVGSRSPPTSGVAGIDEQPPFTGAATRRAGKGHYVVGAAPAVEPPSSICDIHGVVGDAKTRAQGNTVQANHDVRRQGEETRSVKTERCGTEYPKNCSRGCPRAQGENDRGISGAMDEKVSTSGDAGRHEGLNENAVRDESTTAATATAVARGLCAYDAARSWLEGVATLGIGTQRVTARLQIRGFPFFSLLPAGMGEPMIERFEEEARQIRAGMRRRATLDEIDRAKEQQRLNKDEQEKKRAETLRLAKEEQAREEIDLYERGLCLRQRATTRESEKAQAQGFWRRLVTLRQSRRKGTPGAAAAINNLGVLLVEHSRGNLMLAAEGCKLLKEAIDMAEAGLRASAISVEGSGDVMQGITTASSAGTKKSKLVDHLARDASDAPGNGTSDGNMDKGVVSGAVLQGKDAVVDGAQLDPTRGKTPKIDDFTPREEWAAILALSSSNLCFAMEGPGRASYSKSQDEQEDRKTKAESVLQNGNAGGRERYSRSSCEDLFRLLPPRVLSVASGPSDSWTCAGIGVALFEQEDPFWWTRTVTKDDEGGEIGMTENEKNESTGLIVGDVVKARRNAVIRNRATPSNVDGQGGEGGYTNLEVLEVLDPARAARIRLRQARQRAQQKRRKFLLKRRKETHRQLRRQIKETEAACAVAGEKARDPSCEHAVSRSQKPVEQDRGVARGKEGRLVRAIGAVKTLRERFFERNRERSKDCTASGGAVDIDLTVRQEHHKPLKWMRHRTSKG